MVITALLEAHAAVRTQYDVLHKRLLDTVRDDPLCRRLMTTPGVGPVIALTFQATVDEPERFPKSRLVGAHFGLTPKQIRLRRDRPQRSDLQVRRRDDAHGAVRSCPGPARLHQEMVSGLKAWGMAIARRRGLKRAIVAVARKLAVILHRMWLDGQRVPLGQGGVGNRMIQ